jgi:hypothetical protein
VAAWGLPTEDLRTIVGGAKRSEPYRRVRAELVSVCPTDVWVEDGLGFVQFEAGCEGVGCSPGWIVFGVSRAEGTLAAAKAIRPGPAGDHLVVEDLVGAATSRKEEQR